MIKIDLDIKKLLGYVTREGRVEKVGSKVGGKEEGPPSAKKLSGSVQRRNWSKIGAKVGSKPSA